MVGLPGGSPGQFRCRAALCCRARRKLGSDLGVDAELRPGAGCGSEFCRRGRIAALDPSPCRKGRSDAPRCAPGPVADRSRCPLCGPGRMAPGPPPGDLGGDRSRRRCPARATAGPTPRRHRPRFGCRRPGAAAADLSRLRRPPGAGGAPGAHPTPRGGGADSAGAELRPVPGLRDRAFPPG